MRWSGKYFLMQISRICALPAPALEPTSFQLSSYCQGITSSTVISISRIDHFALVGSQHSGDLTEVVKLQLRSPAASPRAWHLRLGVQLLHQLICSLQLAGPLIIWCSLSNEESILWLLGYKGKGCYRPYLLRASVIEVKPNTGLLM